MTRTEFDIGLEQLRQRLLDMSMRVDTMLANAVSAVVEQDIELATQVVRTDDLIDQLEIEIESDCIRLIALQAPVARDLRLIGSSMQIITDVERIGDYAVDIAKIGRRLAKNALFRPLIDLTALSDLARSLLRDAMSAFIYHDLERVQRVIEADDAVDDLFHRQRDHLIAHIEQDPKDARTGVHLLFAAKYLERAADHSVNIAERVHYVETGQVVSLAPRHSPAS
jgi:phosphate transport system protein